MRRLLSGLRLRISTRLTLWYGLTLLILLSLFALFSYVYFHTSLHRDFDRHLAHETRQLLPFLQTDADVPRFAGLSELRSVAYQTDGVYGTYVRLTAAGGEVVYQSPNFQEHESLPLRLPDQPEERTVSREWEGEPVRSTYTPIQDAEGTLHGWLEVTGFEWSLHQELENLRTSLIAGIVLGLLLAIGGGYLLARRALEPVASLTDAAKEIHATDLQTRLPTQFGVRDELTDLAETFNKMIERLEASFERERRFTNNAAHEMLTPLSTIRNSSEIALRRDRTPESYQYTLRAVLADAEEMTDTVRGLLQLARVDRIQELSREHVNLSAVVDAHVQRFCQRAERKGIELSAHIKPDVMVLADAGRIGEVVDNLIDNALKYTPEGGHVAVSVGATNGRVEFVVSDTGVGFEKEEGEHLFDRFYRSDAPEVQQLSGSGLGLAIVQAIANAYGGRVSARSEGKAHGSTFRVELPGIRDRA